ncbi:MAG: hypothetical protein HYX78_14230 [Armatimonadetes bacterium]|nr:hypothetical protein [Armatimonadota bacterium]
MKKKLVLIPIASLVFVTAGGLVTGDVHSAQYKGSATCKMCHKAMNKEIVSGYETSAHPKAIQKADAANAIVADFSSNTAFTKDKVAYVLGTGRNEQAYLDANFQVLPAIWNVKSKSWTATKAVDGNTQCVGCHVTGFDAANKTHKEMGVGCESCHGPGSDHTGGPSKANIVNPKNLTGAKKAMVCGQCHSVGKDTTGNFAFPTNFRPGDDLTKSFVDAKPTSPGRNQQYSEWIQSKHGQMGLDCTTCHDPHNTTGIKPQLKKPINELCLGCHAGTVKDLATHAPGAPADATCATCHMPEGQHTFKTPAK